METKKLIAALVLVVVVGLGAHVFLAKMDHKHDKKWHDKKDAKEQAAPATDSAEQNEEDEEDGEVIEPSAAADTAVSAPVVNTPPPEPAPAPNQGVDDVLSDFGEEDESYDDSGLDADFSGNLDDGI